MRTAIAQKKIGSIVAISQLGGDKCELRGVESIFIAPFFSFRIQAVGHYTAKKS